MSGSQSFRGYVFNSSKDAMNCDFLRKAGADI
jgi:hypothetical protein